MTTLATFLQPVWLAVLLAWSFAVLSAAQLTIRLIMAFSVLLTLRAAVVLALAALPVALVYDAVVGPQPSLGARFAALPISMLLRNTYPGGPVQQLPHWLHVKVSPSANHGWVRGNTSNFIASILS